MGRQIRTGKTTFTSGELDDVLLARTDTAGYYNGANKLRNVVVQPQGGAQRRPGAIYRETLPFLLEPLDLAAMTMPNGGDPANIIDDDPDTTSTTTTPIGTVDPYVIAQIDFGLTPQVVGAAEVVSISFSGGTGNPNSVDEVRIQWSTDNIVWNDYGLPIGSMRRDQEFDIYHQESRVARYWRLARVGATDLNTHVYTLASFYLFGGAPSGTVSPVRLKPFQFSTEQNYLFAFTDQLLTIYKDGVRQAGVSIPFTAEQLPAISVLQSLDTMLVFHEDVQTFEIRRDGSDTQWLGDPVTYTNIPQFDFGDGDEDVWSDARGWPRCGTFHQGRLFVAGSAQRPQTMWGSVSGEFFNFNIGTGLDDEAIDVTLDTDDVASIFNLYSGRHLQIFTSSGEFYVLPENDVVTPKNISVRRTTQVGSFRAGVPVLGLEGATLFVQRLGNAIREFIFTDLNNPYEANSLQLLAPNLIDDPSEIALRRALNVTEGDLVFTTNLDGSIGVLQTLRSQDVTAWSLWVAGGLVKAVNVDLDTVYMAVERTVNGSTVLYLESFNADTFTDSAVKYTTDPSSPTQLPATTLTGLDHLEGETVQILADGAVQDDAVVVGGSVTLVREAETTAEVGLAFPDVQEDEVNRLISKQGYTEIEAREIVYQRPGVTEGSGFGVWIRDNPVDLSNEGLTTMGLKKRVVEITLRLNRTTGIFVSANGRPAEEVIFRTFGANLLDEPPPLFSGDKQIGGILGFRDVDYVDLLQKNPVPMLALGMSKKVTF